MTTTAGWWWCIEKYNIICCVNSWKYVHYPCTNSHCVHTSVVQTNKCLLSLLFVSLSLSQSFSLTPTLSLSFNLSIYISIYLFIHPSISLALAWITPPPSLPHSTNWRPGYGPMLISRFSPVLSAGFPLLPSFLPLQSLLSSSLASPPPTLLLFPPLSHAAVGIKPHNHQHQQQTHSYQESIA